MGQSHHTKGTVPFFCTEDNYNVLPEPKWPVHILMTIMHSIYIRWKFAFGTGK